MKNAKTTRHRNLSVLLCTLLSMLTGCLDAVVGDVDICTVDGKGYSLNESFPASDGCNSCTCLADGNAACTQKACLNDGGANGSDGGSAGQCSYGGKTWKAGDKFSSLDGCNTCQCSASGDVACTLTFCGGGGGCTDGKNTYKPGETYQPGGCGSCTCQADGTSTCLAIACATSCTDSTGKIYLAGETFASPDGCNTCSCGSDGKPVCTERACDPGTCVYNGRTYKEGETFTDALGCNGCGCNNGSVVCDAKYCDAAQACSKGDATFASGTSVICEDGCNTCLCNNTSWSGTDAACQPLQKVESCPTTPAGIEKVRLLYREGDKLAVEVGTGGCAPDKPAFKLCFDGSFRESYPVQATLNLIPTTITSCSSWVTQTRVFDLSPLRAAYQSGYQSQTGVINVSLDGTGFQYKF